MNDSIDKIVKYFGAMSEQEFTYKGETIQTKPLFVSPLLLRDFLCPPNCGACCPVFTLDYLPGEAQPDSTHQRVAWLNGEHPIFSDLQAQNERSHCKYVQYKDARCSIYEKRPFSCDFELIRVLQYKDHYRLTQQPFGRAWNLTKVDGTKGALCHLFKSSSGQKEVLRKLRRLERWMEYFEVKKNRIQKIIDAIPALNSGRTLYFSGDTSKGYFL